MAAAKAATKTAARANSSHKGIKGCSLGASFMLYDPHISVRFNAVTRSLKANVRQLGCQSGTFDGLYCKSFPTDVKLLLRRKSAISMTWKVL
jgi:hypothetical protein